MKALPLIFFLAFCLYSVPALAENPPELNKIRFQFEVELAELVKPLQNLNAKYREHLGKQKEAFQQAGNLEAVLAVDAEIGIFEAELTKEFSSIPELKRLQEIYREQKRKVNNQLIGKKLPLIRSYSEKAKELSIQWTKEGKLKEAKLALDESKEIAAMATDSTLVRTLPDPASKPAATGVLVSGKAGEEMENSIGMKLCWIPPGQFTMGSPEEEEGRNAGREKQVEVELTKGFWMAKYEVTQTEFESVMGFNPSNFKDGGPLRPVESVNWTEAMEFCSKLTALERAKGRLPENWACTLPTEAQWEYACRAGTEAPYSSRSLDRVGWFKGNSGNHPRDVGEKNDNDWGLHDMHGNIREWCLDCFGDELESGKDPDGPGTGSQRSHRGGSWLHIDTGCRSADRGGSGTGYKSSRLGFRVALVFAN